MIANVSGTVDMTLFGLYARGYHIDGYVMEIMYDIDPIKWVISHNIC